MQQEGAVELNLGSHHSSEQMCNASHAQGGPAFQFDVLHITWGSEPFG